METRHQPTGARTAKAKGGSSDHRSDLAMMSPDLRCDEPGCEIQADTMHKIVVNEDVIFWLCDEHFHKRVTFLPDDQEV